MLEGLGLLFREAMERAIKPAEQTCRGMAFMQYVSSLCLAQYTSSTSQSMHLLATMEAGNAATAKPLK
jgi:hypothetical protein